MAEGSIAESQPDLSLTGNQNVLDAQRPVEPAHAAGTLAMLVAMEEVLQIPASFQRRWIYSSVMAALLILIGFGTLLFMLRVI